MGQTYNSLILPVQDSSYNKQRWDWHKLQITRCNTDPIISARLQRSNQKPSNKQQQMSLAATTITSEQIAALDSDSHV